MKIFLLVFSLALSAQQRDWRAEMRQSFERMMVSEKRLEDYGFVRRMHRKEMNSDGSVKKEERLVVRRELFEGDFATFVIEKNGVATTPAQRAQAEAEARAARKAGKARGRASGRPGEDGWIEEFPEALLYTLEGEQSINGRKVWVLRCEPRPGYKPKNIRAKVFEKMRGKVWIDQLEKDIVRVDAEMFDAVSVGFGVLGKIDKGTRFHLDRIRTSEGVWLTAKTDVRFAVRIMLFKYLFNEIVSETSDYRLRPGS